jgi:hypothetical protein
MIWLSVVLHRRAKGRNWIHHEIAGIVLRH